MTGAAPPDPRCGWTAEIVWNQRAAAGSFSVVARSAGVAAPVVVAESGALEWPPRIAASVQAVSDAARTLEAALAAAGWQPLAPGGAWYAKRFAWEPADPRADAAEPPPRRAGAGTPFDRAPPWPDGAHQLWRCEIAWDAGWVESRFQALGYAPRRRRGRAIAASAALPRLLMGRPDPDSAAHRESLHALEAELEASDWEPVGHGADWYATRFCRKLGAPDVYDPSERSPGS